MRVFTCLFLGAVCLCSTILADFTSSDFRLFDEDDEMGGDWSLPNERRPVDKPFPLYNRPLTPEEIEKFTDEFQARRKFVLERLEKARAKNPQPPLTPGEKYCRDMLFVASSETGDASGAAQGAYQCLEHYKTLKYEDLPEFMKKYIRKPAESSTAVPTPVTPSTDTPVKDAPENEEMALKPNTVSSPYPPTPAKPPQKSVTQDYIHVDMAAK